MTLPFRRAVRIGLGVLLCCVALGCGDGKTFRVSGTVTFDGRPVPAGKVYILPDGAKGNTGPAGFADIKNGQYDTGARGGKGAVAGAVVFAVEGLDPDAALDKAEPDVTVKLLFSQYKLPAELPASASTKDIAVPAAAAKGPVTPKGTPIIIP